MCSPTSSCSLRLASCCSQRQADTRAAGELWETSAPAASTPPAPAARDLNHKLATFDRTADAAFGWLLAFAEEHRDEILTVARARHITGHFVHGDRLMYEYSLGRLAKEIVEELADGVCYSACRLGK